MRAVLADNGNATKSITCKSHTSLRVPKYPVLWMDLIVRRDSFALTGKCFRQLLFERTLGFLPADPFRQSQPVRVILGCKLPASWVDGVAPRVRCERVDQKPAHGRLAGNHEGRGALEIEPRLLLGPKGAPRRQLLQVEGGGVLLVGMAIVAASVARPLFQEDGLNASRKKLKINRLRRGGLRSHLRCRF